VKLATQRVPVGSDPRINRVGLHYERTAKQFRKLIARGYRRAYVDRISSPDTVPPGLDGERVRHSRGRKEKGTKPAF